LFLSFLLRDPKAFGLFLSGAMSSTGVVKSFAEQTGWGFIIYNGQDVFFHIRDCVQGLPQKGDTLYFDVDAAEKPGQLVAKNISGGTGGGPCEGIVTSFVDDTGYGFIDYQGQQVFLHINEVVGGKPMKGNKVFFTMEPSQKTPGQMVAKNVKGGMGPKREEAKGKGKGGLDMWGGWDMASMAGFMGGQSQGGYGGKGGKAASKGTAPGATAAGAGKGGAIGTKQGTVQSFVYKSGYGFIDHFGKQVFVHTNDVAGNTLQKGDIVNFEMEPSTKNPSQMVAKNVSGGTGPPKEMKGGEKGGGKGSYGPMMGMEGMGAMMGAMMSMMMNGPYGKGAGKGW